VSDKYTIDKVLTDKRLLGVALGDASSWTVWLAVLKAAFGLTLDDEELEMFASIAGNRAPPTQRVRELWAIVGRRGGKSRMAAALAVYFACFVKHKLAHGERGMVLVLAMSLEQAKVVFSYALAFLRESSVLRKEIAETTRSEIRLKNGIVIAIHANSFRSVRGRTLCAAILDEVSFWRDELSAAPDSETYSALLPSLLTTAGMLVGISTGYRRAGLMHQKHRDFFGVDSTDTLVVQGSTQRFNQTIDDAALAALRAADPAAASSEWDGTFRDDIAAFLDDALIDGAIEHGRPLELPPQAGIHYRAFTDASGGRGDAYTLCIGHKEGACFVIDVIRGTHPAFDPHEVTRGYAALLKEYRISDVIGDHYAAEWVAGAWRDCGVAYIRSEQNKSAIYLEALPLFTRGLIRLPDHARLLRELRLLERHTQRSGKDSVDHGRNGSDDYANALCGVLKNLASAAPALWARSSLLVDEAGVAMPSHCDLVFAVLIASPRGDTAVTYWAYNQVVGHRLILLDVDVAHLNPAIFHGVASRLVDLATTCRARYGSGFLYTTSVLASELRRLGYHIADEIDALAAEDDEVLALSAATHIGSGRVKITAQALASAEHHPLGGILDATTHDDDPLRTAALIGVALALDEGRSLKARAA
jgi:hypothetical protein